jgi:hypothetical protein
MSIKIALLKSGETIISDIKELVSKEENLENKHGYVFTKPRKVTFSVPILVQNSKDSEEDDKTKLEKSVEISFSPWILLSKDEEILVPIDWVVTVVEPIDNVKNTYENEVNGSNN